MRDSGVLGCVIAAAYCCCYWLCVQAKECMLFAGTGIASGACLGVVNSIGMDTEIGKIQAQIQVGGLGG